MLIFKNKVQQTTKKHAKLTSMQRVFKSIPPAVLYQFLVDIVGCVKDRFYLGLYCSNIMTFIHFHYRFRKLSQNSLLFILSFSLEKKGYVNFATKSVPHPSVRLCDVHARVSCFLY